MRALVTGGAGFIGSHLVSHLVTKGHDVVVVDNLSSGNYNYIKDYVDSGDVTYLRMDLKEFDEKLISAFKSVDVVYHLAANPEVRVSTTEPRVHFNENVLATFNVLEACRLYSVRTLIFTSSSAVYGDAKIIPTPENYAPLEPISVYGASKLASENLIVTYGKLYGVKGIILRLANIVGPRQTHGVIVDFIRKLRRDPTELEVLGDGTQKKSYLHIRDLLRAIDVIAEYADGSNAPYEVFNVGNDDWIEVNEIARLVISKLNLGNVKVRYVAATSDGRGWIGDVKYMLLDIARLRSIGWKPTMNSKRAVEEAINELAKLGL